MSRTTTHTVAECLVARYRNETWFHKIVKGPGRVTFSVYPACPFRSHRPILGMPVDMEVFEECAPEPVQGPVKRRVRVRPKPPPIEVKRVSIGAACKAVRRIRARRPLRLVNLVMEFRDGLLGPNSPNGACFVVCVALGGYLKEVLGWDLQMRELDFDFTNHFVLVMPDGRVLDPTADQFNVFLPEGAASLPPVYVGSMPSIYQRWMAGAETKKKEAG